MPLHTVITKEGPPLTISCGIWLKGQFSMDIISSLEQSASSKGNACKWGLSLIYNDSKFSRLPISSGTKERRF